MNLNMIGFRIRLKILSNKRMNHLTMRQTVRASYPVFQSRFFSTKKHILVVGGGGTFGEGIAKNLGKKLKDLNSDHGVMISSRKEQKARELAQKYSQESGCQIGGIEFNTTSKQEDLMKILKSNSISCVIDTSGPFTRDYPLAKLCIASHVDYVDISENMDYVTGIEELDEEAKKAGVRVISGSSSVVAFSSAIVEDFINREFSTVEVIRHSITTGNKINLGPGVIESVLSNLGKEYQVFKNGKWKNVLAFSELELQLIPGMEKRRLIGHFPAPDVKIFPKKWRDLGLKTVEFKAGIELKVLMLVIHLMSRLRKYGIIPDVSRFVEKLMALKKLFNFFGTKEGGMTVSIEGTHKTNPAQKHSADFFVWSGSGHGINIPGFPAVIVATKFATKDPLVSQAGAKPCVGMITLDEMRSWFQHFDIVADQNGVGQSASKKLPIFEQGLGRELNRSLPKPVAKFHSEGGLVEGKLVVTRGTGLANLAATLGGLPTASLPNQSTFVRVQVKGPVWKRFFGNEQLHSFWSTYNGLVVEKMYSGFFQFGFQLKPIRNEKTVGFSHVTRRMWFLWIIPVPGWLTLSADGKTLPHEDGKGWLVEVFLTNPLLGQILCYRGDVRVIE